MSERTTSMDLGHIYLSDRVFGVLILVIGIAAIVFTRSIAVILPVVAVAAAIELVLQRSPLKEITSLSTPVLALAALLGFAAISALWSADAATTLTHSALFVFTLLLGHLLAYWASVQPQRRVRHLSYWLTIAFLLGLAVLMFEVLSSQWLRRTMMEYSSIFNPPKLGKHYSIRADGSIRIAPFELNRSIAAANMLVWPVALCAASYWSGRRFALVAAALVGGVILTTIASVHETSKIALLGGGVVFALAYFWRPVSRVVAAAVWTVLVLGVVPLTIAAHDYLHLQDAPWVQNSARARIIIWKDVADTVMKAPLLGVGARTGYVLNEREAVGNELPKVPRHAHNVYLQTWYELGLVGATLLLIAGVLCLRAISALPNAAYPFALATFAVCAAELATSWEIWQRWFFMLYILAWFCLALGIKGSTEKSNVPAP